MELLLKERLVTTDKLGNIAIRDAQGRWRTNLSPEYALKFASKHEIALALHREEMLHHDYTLPRFDGENFLWQGVTMPHDDLVDDLQQFFGYSEADAIAILEVARIAHRFTN